MPLAKAAPIHVGNGASIYFQHVALVNGNAFATDVSSDNGGAVLNAGGSASFDESFACQSYAQNGGGYFGTATATTDMTGTTIGRCTVAQVPEDENGNFDPLFVDYDTYVGNYAESNGAGVYIGGGPADLRNVALWYNHAGLGGTGNGGGIYNISDDTRIINGIIVTNSVPNNGGGVFNSGSNFQLLHNTIRDNYAGNQGGGIYNNSISFSMNSSIVYSNTAGATSGAGGLFSTNPVAMTHNNFYDNTPNDSSSGTGVFPVVGHPQLLGLYVLGVNSPNIDAADPNLLSNVDFDASMRLRPDGFNLPYEPPHGLYADVGAYEYLKDFGCEIDPASETRPADPGDVVTFTLQIINTGNPPYTAEEYWWANGYTDTITVTVENEAQGWAEFEGGDIQTIELGWQDFMPYGETATRVLTVTVPATATVGMDEVVDLRCQSASLPIREKFSQNHYPNWEYSRLF